MIPSNDIRWLVGYLEGEGAFMAGSPPGVRPRISVTTTDFDVAGRVALLWDRPIHIHKPSSTSLSKKTQYVVDVHSSKAIGWMMTLYSLLGLRRKAKILDILNFWRARGTNLSALKYYARKVT